MKAHLGLLIVTIAVVSLGFSAQAQTTGPTLDEAIEGYENATGQKLQGLPTRLVRSSPDLFRAYEFSG